MRNVQDDAPVLFGTRWAMSYLRGPLTLVEIRTLAANMLPGGTVGAPSAAASATVSAHVAANPTEPAPNGAAATRPLLQPGVNERFLDTDVAAPVYRPNVGARVRAHYVDAKSGVDAWEARYYVAPATSAGPDWPAAQVSDESALRLRDSPAPGASFTEVAGKLLAPAAYRSWATQLTEFVYRSSALEVFRCPALKRTSAAGGSEGDFRALLAQELREQRDAAIDTLRGKYAKRLAMLEDRQRRADQKLERERSQASSETTSSLLNVGGSVLGALFGSRRGALSKASTAARRIGRVSKERADVAHAEADAESLRAQESAVEVELEAEVAALGSRYDPATIHVETLRLRPRKSDIAVEDIALVWSP